MRRYKSYFRDFEKLSTAYSHVAQNQIDAEDLCLVDEKQKKVEARPKGYSIENGKESASIRNCQILKTETTLHLCVRILVIGA